MHMCTRRALVAVAGIPNLPGHEEEQEHLYTCIAGVVPQAFHEHLVATVHRVVHSTHVLDAGG